MAFDDLKALEDSWSTLGEFPPDTFNCERFNPERHPIVFEWFFSKFKEHHK